MTQLIPIDKPTFDLDKAIRSGLLRESDRPAVGCFLRYLQENGYTLADPEGWKAYSDHLRQPVE
jgi:hypothetical protein